MICKCEGNVSVWDHILLAFCCVQCGKRKRSDSDPFLDKPLRSLCDCGADKVYGKGNNMHSATMPCSAYKKVT